MRSALALVLILAFTSLSVGEACEPTTTAPVIDVDGRYYLDADCHAGPVNCRGFLLMAGWWLYEEANGIAGLQRADDVVDDTCGGAIVGDRIVV